MAHPATAPRSARCATLTVSDTRTAANDRSGARLRELLEAEGHTIHSARIVTDEPSEIRAAIAALLEGDRPDAILLTGGTGIAPRDRSPEVVREFFDLEIEGFGELFRMLSHREIGPAAMLSRATAGIARGVVLVAMPGSTKAVELAMRELILPEMSHMRALLDSPKSGA